MCTPFAAWQEQRGCCFWLLCHHPHCIGIKLPHAVVVTALLDVFMVGQQLTAVIVPNPTVQQQEILSCG